MASELSPKSPSIKIVRSTCTFQFEIDYSKSKDLPAGEFISSPTFTSGGYDWALQYYPKGCNSEEEEEEEEHGFTNSLFLCLKTDVDKIAAEFSLEILNNESNFITFNHPGIVYFTSSQRRWCYTNFPTGNIIDNLCCVNGVLSISCGIRVRTEPRAVKNYPGGLGEHIEKLREKGERYDVTFEVQGENISAHRLILAARSPVFEAELFGPMAEAKMARIKLDEMKAVVFKALLHFVYTDQLAIDEPSDDETVSVELLHDLLAAADRYALDKLTLLCEEQLVKSLSVETVVTTLQFADRHRCVGLKTKCLEFASDPDNFSRVAFSENFFDIMSVSRSLRVELRDRVKCSSHFAKKQRTS